MYAAVAVAERKRYLATYVVNHWRGALCRRAYCSCRLVNATLTQRHRVRRPPSLRLHLTLPTPSLRLATTSTAFFRAVAVRAAPEALPLALALALACPSAS